MGAGLALEASQRFPQLAYLWGRLVRTFGNLPFYAVDFGLISFPTKNHWQEPSDLQLIEKSALILNEATKLANLSKIVLPKVGCGLGRLDWELVRSKLDDILDDRFVVVHNDNR